MDFKNAPGGVTSSPVSASELKSDGLFARMRDELAKNPAKGKSVNGVFLYNVTDAGKVVKKWTLDLKKGEAYEGEPKSGKPDTTLTLSDADLVEIASGSLSPQVAFMKGKLKIAGNMMLAQKLGPLLQSEAKL
nr:peroxisomal multifunctional enzyme type 2 [Galleria mellonella]